MYSKPKPKKTKPELLNCNCDILDACTPDWRAYITDHCEVISFKKGQLVFHEGMAAVGAYYILEGKVKVFKTGFNNKKQIINLNKSGEVIGHRAWNRSHMSISAEVLEDARIAFLEKHHLEKIFTNNPALTYKFMLFYADELNYTENLTRNHAQMNVRELCASALLRIVDRIGVRNDGYLDLEFSRQDLAELAGTSKEQISKHLSDFIKEGLIVPEGRKIKLADEQRLRNIIKDFPDL